MRQLDGLSKHGRTTRFLSSRLLYFSPAKDTALSSTRAIVSLLLAAIAIVLLMLLCDSVYRIWAYPRLDGATDKFWNKYDTVGAILMIGGPAIVCAVLSYLLRRRPRN